jgi:REP element-mobilizing transposase RayT
MEERLSKVIMNSGAGMHRFVKVEVSPDHIHFSWERGFTAKYPRVLSLLNDITESVSMPMQGFYKFDDGVKFQVGSDYMEFIAVDEDVVFIKQNGQKKHMAREPSSHITYQCDDSGEAVIKTLIGQDLPVKPDNCQGPVQGPVQGPAQDPQAAESRNAIGAALPYDGGMHFVQRHCATQETMELALKKENLPDCVKVEVRPDHIHFMWPRDFIFRYPDASRIINDIVDSFNARLYGAFRFAVPVKVQVGDDVVEVVSVDETQVIVKQNGEFVSYLHKKGPQTPPQTLLPTQLPTQLPTLLPTLLPTPLPSVHTETLPTPLPTKDSTPTGNAPSDLSGDFFDGETFDIDEMYNTCNVSLKEGNVRVFLSVVSDVPFDDKRRDDMANILTRTYVNVADARVGDPENEIYLVTRCKRRGQVENDDENNILASDRAVLEEGEVRVMRARTVYETQKKVEDLLRQQLSNAMLKIESLRNADITKIQESIARTLELERAYQAMQSEHDKENEFKEAQIKELKQKISGMTQIENLCAQNLVNVTEISAQNTVLHTTNEKLLVQFVELEKAMRSKLDASEHEITVLRKRLEDIELQKQVMVKEGKDFVDEFLAAKAGCNLLIAEEQAKRREVENKLKKLLKSNQKQLTLKEQEIAVAKESMALSAVEFYHLQEENAKNLRVIDLKNAEIHRRGLEINKRDEKIREMMRSVANTSGPVNVLPEGDPDEAFALEHDSFVCPISLLVMRDPVVATDGHSYERECIELHFQQQSKGGSGEVRSPLSNEPLASRLLTPNIALLAAIRDALAARKS